MKNYRLILIVAFLCLLVMIVDMWGYIFYLKRQSDLLTYNFDMLCRRISALETKVAAKEAFSLKERVESLMTKDKERDRQLKASKGNQGYLIKDSQSTYSLQRKTK